MKRVPFVAVIAVAVLAGCGQTQAPPTSTTSHVTADVATSASSAVSAAPAPPPAEEPAYEEVVLGVATPTSPVPAVATTLGSLREQSRACYTQVSARHPGAGGRLRVTFVIAPSGDVKTATIVANGGLPKALAECVVEHAKKARFQAPEGSKEVAMSLWIAFGGAAP